MSPLLEVRGLRKAFGGLTVTDGVDLTLAHGELHALIGPNGAGKTTLINQLSGAIASDAGSVRLEGRDITALPMAERALTGLARSFQIISVLRSFSVLENVALAVQARSGSSFRFWRAASGDETIDGPAREALARFGLLDRADRRADALSYGETRQLELAVALATHPKALLLDEPLAGTSHEEARGVIEVIRSLKGEIGILLVEHDMDAVFALADRVSVLVAGRIVASDTPARIRADPEVRRAYLGEEAA